MPAADPDDWDDPILRQLAHAPSLPPPRAFQGTDRFEVRRKLGAGAFGTVFEVLDRRRGTLVALKVLRAARPEAIYRFKQEFRSLSDLVHPNLVRLDELVADGDRWLLVMELVRGVPFDEYVGGSPERLREAALGLASGLVALHRAGKLHRDVKPSNVLVEPGGRVVLLDFGLAVEREADPSDELAGTPRFMAPEARSGRCSEASDFYAMGVMLEESLARIDPVPPPLGALCTDLLQPDPARRPAGAEVLRRLAGSERNLPVAVGERFVGRGPELEEVAAALEAARPGHPVFLTVLGESGVGKTSFLRRAKLLLRGRIPELLWLEGRCRERESVPYKALDDVIDSLVRWLERLSPEERDELLPPQLPDLARQFPAFATLAAPAHSGGARGDRRSAVAALRELICRLARRRRLVLALDDVQWGDADSAAVLEELTRPPDSPGVLYIASCRDRELASSPLMKALGASALIPPPRTLRLAPLGPEDSAELARQLAGKSRASEDIDLVVRESGGNPLFIRELLLGDPGARVTLSGAILGRVEKLGEAERRLLEAAAVADHPESAVDLARAAAVEGEALGALAGLRASQLVRTRELAGVETVECYHDRIREAVQAALPLDRRRVLHERLAGALRHSAAADGAAERIARHYLAAGRPEEAAELAIASAERAAASFAYEHAAELLRLAIQVTDPEGDRAWRLRRSLGEVLAASGRGSEAADALLAAARTAPPSEAIDLRRRAATALLAAGYVERGLDVLRGAMKGLGLEVPRGPGAAILSLLYRRLRIAARGLDFVERSPRAAPDELRRVDALGGAALALATIYPAAAAALSAHGLASALECGEPSRVASALNREAIFSAFQPGSSGRRRARLYRARALALEERLGDGPAKAFGLYSDGFVDLLEGRWVDCGEKLSRVLALRARGEPPPDIDFDFAQSVKLNALFSRGRAGDLGREVPPFLQDLRYRGHRLGVMWMSLYQSFVSTCRDRPDQARREVRQAMREWAVPGFHMQSWWEVMATVYVELYEGNGAAAWAEMESVWPKLERAFLLSDQLHRIEARWIRCRAALACASSCPPRLRELLGIAQREAQRIERERVAWGNALARSIRASAAWVAGSIPEARALLAEAEPLLEASHFEAVLAAVRRAQGLLAPEPARAGYRERSNAWMESQDIVKPERFARLYLPGRW